MTIQNELFGAMRNLLSSGKITLKDLSDHVNQTYASFNGNTMNEGKLSKYIARQFGAGNVAALSSETTSPCAIYQDIVSFFLEPKSGYRLIWDCEEKEHSEIMRFFLPLFENTYLIPSGQVCISIADAKQPVYWGIGCDVIWDKVTDKIYLSFDTVQSKPNEDIDPDMGFESNLCVDVDSTTGRYQGNGNSVHVAFNDMASDGGIIACSLMSEWKVCKSIPAPLEDAVTYIKKKNMTWTDAYKFLRPEVARICLPLQRYAFKRSMNLDVDNTNFYNFVFR
jgi:hypothetical protein